MDKLEHRELRRRARSEHVMARLKRFRILGGRFSLAPGGHLTVMKAAALIHKMEKTAA